MLERKHRFHGYSSLKKTYPKTKNVRGALISLRYAARPANRPYRVAVVVGKKVHKSAVKRNRIRRRVYEAIYRSSLVPESTDLIFTVYNDQVAVVDFSSLEDQINDLLSRITSP